MKVAHVINSLNRGGAESHLLELVKAQSNTGLTTDVIVIGEDSSDILSIKKELSSVCRKIYRLKGPCLLYTSPSPRDLSTSRMPSSA